METTYNKLTEKGEIFFKNLKKYLNEPIYFFGSIQRWDYFFGSSDIDVCIFFNNIKEGLLHLENILNMNQDDFKEIVWKKKNKIIKGYKCMYKNETKDLIVEFSIYDLSNKDFILQEHNAKIYLPFYKLFMLIILKFIYYTLKMIDDKTFRTCKRYILNIFSFSKKSDEDYIAL